MTSKNAKDVKTNEEDKAELQRLIQEGVELDMYLARYEVMIKKQKEIDDYYTKKNEELTKELEIQEIKCSYSKQLYDTRKKAVQVFNKNKVHWQVLRMEYRTEREQIEQNSHPQIKYDNLMLDMLRGAVALGAKAYKKFKAEQETIPEVRMMRAKEAEVERITKLREELEAKLGCQEKQLQELGIDCQKRAEEANARMIALQKDWQEKEIKLKEQQRIEAKLNELAKMTKLYNDKIADIKAEEERKERERELMPPPPMDMNNLREILAEADIAPRPVAQMDLNATFDLSDFSDPEIRENSPKVRSRKSSLVVPRSPAIKNNYTALTRPMASPKPISSKIQSATPSKVSKQSSSSKQLIPVSSTKVDRIDTSKSGTSQQQPTQIQQQVQKQEKKPQSNVQQQSQKFIEKPAQVSQSAEKPTTSLEPKQSEETTKKQAPAEKKEKQTNQPTCKVNEKQEVAKVNEKTQVVKAMPKIISNVPASQALEVYKSTASNFEREDDERSVVSVGSIFDDSMMPKGNDKMMDFDNQSMMSFASMDGAGMYSKKMDLAEFAFGASSPKFDETSNFGDFDASRESSINTSPKNEKDVAEDAPSPQDGSGFFGSSVQFQMDSNKIADTGFSFF